MATRFDLLTAVRVCVCVCVCVCVRARVCAGCQRGEPFASFAPQTGVDIRRLEVVDALKEIVNEVRSGVYASNPTPVQVLTTLMGANFFHAHVLFIFA